MPKLFTQSKYIQTNQYKIIYFLFFFVLKYLAKNFVSIAKLMHATAFLFCFFFLIFYVIYFFLSY